MSYGTSIVNNAKEGLGGVYYTVKASEHRYFCYEQNSRNSLIPLQNDELCHPVRLLQSGFQIHQVIYNDSLKL